jgi:hypothetical protein
MRGYKNVILNHLQTKGPLTSEQAFELYGVTRISAVVFDLRKLGYNIVTEKAIGKTRYGETSSYGIYKLKENNKDG